MWNFDTKKTPLNERDVIWNRRYTDGSELREISM